MEDYRKYLSIDNGKGLLISKYDACVLDRYSIDYMNVINLKDLIVMVEDAVDEFEDEELEMVLEHLSETYYYQEVNK